MPWRVMRDVCNWHPSKLSAWTILFKDDSRHQKKADYWIELEKCVCVLLSNIESATQFILLFYFLLTHARHWSCRKIFFLGLHKLYESQWWVHCYLDFVVQREVVKWYWCALSASIELLIYFTSKVYVGLEREEREVNLRFFLRCNRSFIPNKLGWI